MIKETIIAAVIAVILCSLIYQGALGSSGLKVKVQIKYSDFVRQDGAGKAVIDYRADHGDKWKHKVFSADNFPKSVTITFKKGVVAVGEYFEICLSSYKWDEGNCANGANSPNKGPEKVRLDFPT